MGHVFAYMYARSLNDVFAMEAIENGGRPIIYETLTRLEASEPACRGIVVCPSMLVVTADDVSLLDAWSGFDMVKRLRVNADATSRVDVSTGKGDNLYRAVFLCGGNP